MLIFKPIPLAMLLTGCLSSAWGAQLTQALTLKDVTVWICPYISRHLLSLNPLLARCRRYSRG
ncbi:hypothetical protein MZE02_22875, partial [Escherichia coli]|nr:hypothetical protein [Escherichia coli]